MTRPTASLSVSGLLLLGLLAGRGAELAAAEPCPAPEPVCAVREAVFAVEGADNGSAVRIGPGRLVTSRHLVAELEEVGLHLADGRRLVAAVVPSSYEADLVLLRVAGLPPGPSLVPEAAAPPAEASLFAVGAAPRTRRIRTYAPGRTLVPIAAGKPLARLHTDAEAEHANSGGALVDAEGRLVGIIASGGGGRNEAVPAGAIATLERLSGPEHSEASRALGSAYRLCDERITAVRRRERRMADGTAAVILQACGASKNRQFFDLAGKLFGSLGRIDEALEMYRQALEQDPHAPNARIGVAITLHLARRYEEELPHLRWLLEVIPADPQILRLAVQAGTWGGDRALAERALALTETHHPNLAPAARRFLERNPPPP
ncbi:MAG: trypsin-like peptidase domain-containing protein [Kiloniellales bacterium]|nr:trypsin-like peptidase domain-containing protein [Kiloniellales bacterium]